MKQWNKLPPRDKQRVLFGVTLTCFVIAVLVKNVQLTVLFILLGLLGVLGTVWVFRNTEVDALRASIEYSRDEITDTIKSYVKYLQSHPKDVALGPAPYSEPLPGDNSPDVSGSPAVRRFRECFCECQRHLESLPEILEDESLTPDQLQKILVQTDNYADELRLSWKHARRAVRSLNREDHSHSGDTLTPRPQDIENSAPDPEA